MGRESSGVVRFDLGPLLQGQTRIAKLKSSYNLLIIGPRDLECQTMIELSLLNCSTGFGELSFQWIEFALVLRCARSSCFLQFCGCFIF